MLFLVLIGIYGVVGTLTHGWATTSTMTFADTRNPKLYTDAEIEFVAAKYRIFSMEKCTGIESGVKTEAAIYQTAQRLKRKNPQIKIFFYLATDQQGIQCYAANSTFMEHPEWWLRDDNGNVVKSNNHPILDCTNPKARAWWTSIPLSGEGNGKFRGQPTEELIDGVLADGGGFGYIANISTVRLEALADAKYKMMGELQAILTQANGGSVMANGISMYGGRNADPRRPNDHNLQALQFTNAIMNEHSAVFESVSIANASLNVETVRQDLEKVVQASQMANGTKAVFVQTWPGLYVHTKFTPDASGPADVYPPVNHGGEPTPQNNSQWREALRSHFTFAQALFLSVAEQNTWWFYGGYWYDSGTGYLPCPDDLNSCPAPPEWYPDLEKPLGAPLGPRTAVSPYVWDREFQHAHVHVDLFHPDKSAVIYKAL